MAQRIEEHLRNDIFSVTTPPVLPDKWKRFKSVEISLSPPPKSPAPVCDHYTRASVCSTVFRFFWQLCVRCTDHQDITATEFRCLIFLDFTTFSKKTV